MPRRPAKRPKLSARLKSVPKEKRTGNGGTQPPVEKQFAKGFDPRRGKGDTARAILTNTFNSLYTQNLTEKQLRAMARDDNLPEHSRQAAQLVLHSRRGTTIADFEEWLEGRKSLMQLKRLGVDVSMVKSASQFHHDASAKERIAKLLKENEVPDTVVARVVILLTDARVRRNIELFSDRGENFDRIMGHTGLAPSEIEKYRRIDQGQSTERFDIVEFIVPGLKPQKDAAKDSVRNPTE